MAGFLIERGRRLGKFVDAGKQSERLLPVAVREIELADKGEHLGVAHILSKHGHIHQVDALLEGIVEFVFTTEKVEETVEILHLTTDDVAAVGMGCFQRRSAHFIELVGLRIELRKRHIALSGRCVGQREQSGIFVAVAEELQILKHSRHLLEPFAANAGKFAALAVEGNKPVCDFVEERE